MAAVFEYEGADDAPLKQDEAKHNARDPTGTAARLLLAGRRQRALQGRPKFYAPEQHAGSPHISVTIRAPSTLSLKEPFPVISTITHHANVSGNPESKPVTFDLADTGLDKIIDDNIYPWLAMHRAASGKLKELDNGQDYTCPPFDNEEGLYDQVPILPENGFVSLAVGDSVDVKAELRYTGDGVDMEKGENYSLNFRGVRLMWWRFGSFKDLEGERKPSQAERGGNGATKPLITLAASNLVDFSVVE
ncbi:MAG: hypothetical protein Q9221_006847 [Calogaya cf. arnoldii]